MPAFVILNPRVTLNGTANNLSASCRSLTIDITAAEVETTNFGGAGWTEMVGGLKGGSVSIEWNDDVAAGAVDSIIWPLLGGTAALTFRPAGTAAIGSANPEYQATVLVTQTTSGGAVGDLATKSVTWPTTGSIARATA
jgi:hypothetical protein